MQKEIIQIGQSLAIIIPKEISEVFGLKKGQTVNISNKKNDIVIQPVQKFAPLNLRGLFKGTKEIKYSEFRKIRKEFTKSMDKKWKDF